MRPTVDAKATTGLGATLFLDRRWPLALAAALLIVGPVLRPGAVLNLDLILVPRLDVPSGFWGLGPELPRRLPLWVPISLLSAVIPATVIGKAILVGQIVLGWTGMARRFGGAGLVAAHTIGALYAVGPFMSTRAVVGHFMITVPLAVLPWVIPVVARPGRDLGATFLAASALGLGGHYGGALAVLVVAAAIAVGARDRWLPALAVTIAAQAPWLVPGLAVWWASNGSPSSSVVFATAVDGPADLARTVVGSGFWNTYYQTGGTGLVGAILGIVLLALALAGTRDLPDDVRPLLVVLAAVGWAVSIVSGLPVADGLFDAITSNVAFAIWRESHRLLGLFVLWLAPAAVLGARRCAAYVRRHSHHAVSGALTAVPLASVIMLTLPVVWAYGGRLESTPLPDGWHQARSIVRDEGGTVLALPWRQYFNLRIGDGDVHRVLGPLPLFLGGDVIASSDNQLGDGVRERGDPREEPLDPLIRRLEEGEAIGSELEGSGVRWIVLLEAARSDLYGALVTDPALDHVLDSEAIDLFEVRSWVGTATDAVGAVADVDQIVPGVAGIDRDAVSWSSPAGRGWRRGWRSTGETEWGTVALRPGSPLIWNVAVLPALLGQIGPLVAVALVVRRRLGSDGERVGSPERA